MDIRKIKKLIELLEDSGVAEIEIKEGEETVRISRSSQVLQTVQGVAPQVVATAPVAQGGDTGTQPEAGDGRDCPGNPVNSPMVGTFYRSPAPGEPPFLNEGDTVEKGQSVCIIEAMKMMNRIEAPASGTVTCIFPSDGDPVEFDQPLFTLKS